MVMTRPRLCCPVMHLLGTTHDRLLCPDVCLSAVNCNQNCQHSPEGHPLIAWARPSNRDDKSGIFSLFYNTGHYPINFHILRIDVSGNEKKQRGKMSFWGINVRVQVDQCNIKRTLGTSKALIPPNLFQIHSALASLTDSSAHLITRHFRQAHFHTGPVGGFYMSGSCDDALIPRCPHTPGCIGIIQLSRSKSARNERSKRPSDPHVHHYWGILFPGMRFLEPVHN
ncbi:hypothetical protein AG1IA_09132 [Rhizoctonia solani AG-1 IA]|uniref:Uncharacterized protein n=1 Tax=Thanatephorus cucumeris (strain AG1-IA) TaxID=983506 RepID=L8WJE2_THACA|nr:hypothetical protein AG1IA_09132 [Rhizoctonia solani AG-1 IA]